MALSMGLTSRRELYERTTSAELAELVALQRIEPIGLERLDYYLSLLIAVQTVDSKPSDFNLSHVPSLKVDVDAQLAKWGPLASGDN